MAGLLAKERIIAQPGFNRWLVPPAALAIHLSIGMAYGFSVFWLPLSRAIGITQKSTRYRLVSQVSYCPYQRNHSIDSGGLFSH